MPTAQGWIERWTYGFLGSGGSLELVPMGTMATSLADGVLGWNPGDFSLVWAIYIDHITTFITKPRSPIL